MIKFSQHKVLVVFILILTLIVNIALYFLNKQQISEIEGLNQEWKNGVSLTIETTFDLAKLERAFGYYGFIHHFKNYILRRDENYFLLANQAYQESVEAISALRNSGLSESSLHDLSIVAATLAEYHQKLQLAQQQWQQYSPYQLDRFVKVDDINASKALVRLKNSLLPRAMQHYNHALAKSEQIATNSVTTFIMTLATLGLFAGVLIILLFKREQTLNHFRAVLDSSPDGIIYADLSGKIISANPAAHKIFGYQHKELLSKSIEDLLLPNLRAKHQTYRQKFSAKPQSRAMGGAMADIVGLTKQGNQVKLDIAISSVEVSGTSHSVAIVRDITDQKTLELQAQKDYLTQLDNRRTIDLKFQEELMRAIRYQRDIAIILIDIDNFKQLNDAQGHLFGDQALKNVANFLQTYSRETDHIGRWGGDEFIMVCPELSPTDAKSLAERMRGEFEIIGQDTEPNITLSFGISSFNREKHYVSAKVLFEQADYALLQAKSLGRNQVVCFDPNKATN